MKKEFLVILMSITAGLASEIPAPPVVVSPKEITRDPFISHEAESIYVDRSDVVEDVVPDFNLMEVVVTGLRKSISEQIKIVGISIKGNSRSALLNVEGLNLNSIGAALTPQTQNITPTSPTMPQTAPTLGGIQSTASVQQGPIKKVEVVFEGRYLPIQTDNAKLMEGLGLLAKSEVGEPIVVWKAKERTLLLPVVSITSNSVEIGLSKDITVLIEKDEQKSPSIREF